MEPWQYSALSTQFSSLLQLLSSSTQNSSNSHSNNNNNHAFNEQAMSVDSVDHDALRSGIKRKLSASDDHNNLSKKNRSRQHICIGGQPKLSLDVYTQTNASYVADQNSTLAKLTDLILENARRLDSIETLLTSIDQKFNIFGSESNNIDRNTKKPELTVEIKPATSFEPIKTPSAPATPSTPASFISDVEANGTALCQTVSNIKSPFTAVTPSVPSVVRLQGIPVTVQSNPDNVWSHNPATGVQGIDSSSKPTNQDSRTEGQTKGLDITDGTSNVLVPVIFASEDKTRRCATSEVVLQDLLNGNVTNPEDSIQIFRGCWLGDRLDPHSRVWYYGDSKIIQRAEASGSNPAKLSLNLLEALFTREEMAASNVNGARGRDLLDPIKIKAIYVHINYKFPTDPDKQELRWHFLKPRIDSKCRAQRRIQRDHQAVGDAVHHSNKERPFRSKLSKPSLDPKIKEELLYGLMKSDGGVTGFSVTQLTSQIANTCNESGVSNTVVDISANVTQATNAASMVYGNNAI